MALYHTYRPQTLEDIVGQEHIVETIKQQLLQKKTAHAYLFSGPRGVGKTSLARILAKALNVPKKDDPATPDNDHPNAQEISASRSIDVIEIDAASHTGVDHVREHIIENAQFKPTKLPYKIFIIDEVHMLSTSAFNALLKTLEEPPAHVVFVLATTEPHKLPDTILSRCQRFHFKRVPHAQMKEHIADIAKKEKVTFDDHVIDSISRKSDGCVRDAMSLMDQLMATGEQHITVQKAALVLPTHAIEDGMTFFSALIKKDISSGLEVLTQLADSGTHFPQFGTELLELQRAALMITTTGNTTLAEQQYADDVVTSLQSLVRTSSAREIVEMMDRTMSRIQDISFAPLPQLPFELLLVELANQDTPITPSAPAQPQKEKPDATEPKKEVEQPKPAPSSIVETRNETPQTTTVEESDADIAEPRAHTEAAREEEFSPSQEEPVPTGDAPSSVDEAIKKWPEVIAAVESMSPSLVFILKMAEITALRGNILVAAVPYSFHRDKIMEDKTVFKNICDILTSVFGTTMEISVEVNEDAQPKSAPPDPDIQEFAAAFGGEVIS